MELFDFDDVKTMINDIGSHLGIKFDEYVISKLLEDYGGHPFLTRQVCSKMNHELMQKKVVRPTCITRYAYEKKSNEYKLEMIGVIEQILGVLQMYYPNEFSLLKKLALDGRKSFAKELSSGEKEIQHLMGYCLIEKDDGEYFIRIKSIEEYLNTKFEYEKRVTGQSEKRARLNKRREGLESRLREIIFFNLKSKYGKKAKERLVSYIKGTTTDKTQETKINELKLKEVMEELYFSQLKTIILKDWKDYQNIFNDRVKFETFFDLVNQSRGAGDHGKSLSDEEEALYNVAFVFFDKCLIDY